MLFTRCEPYKSEYGVVYCVVSDFCGGFETVIGYIIKADNKFKRVWLFGGE